MSTPVFYPRVEFVPRLERAAAIPLRALCQAAGVQCRASGSWTERPIVVDRGEAFRIQAEPGGFGVVRVVVPHHLKPIESMRHALAALAYGLFDGVARESIRGAEWAKPALPKGRRAAGRPLSNAERQRAFRARHATAT